MGARILIVEDNRENMDLMSYLLRAFGYEVTCAVNGEAGLRSAEEEPPDLVVCDLQLPGIDGFEVARRLRSLSRTATTPIVAVTAFAMVGDRERVLATGFHGYISKPIEPTSFVKNLEEFLPVARRTGVTGQMEDTRPSASPTSVPPPIAAVPGDAGMDVLQVDDVEANRYFVRALLEPLGMRIRTVPGSRHALAEMRTRRPTLVLSDMHLGAESGLELLREVRSDAVLRSIPFVFLTATGRDPRNREAAMRDGADGYLLLPMEPALLVEEVRRWMPRSET